MVVDQRRKRFFQQPPGELAQMVERSLSMREVAGSMPAFSKRPPALLRSLPERDRLRCLRYEAPCEILVPTAAKRFFGPGPAHIRGNKNKSRSHRDLNSDRWIQSPEG
ncbi:hypothetical protein ROHU_009437 [Labeo rohita]|uniref:Uncharacterized protein n=1 Tax=Labeo rohita TaxID=84645 RepID=A0A498LZV6_LABRO|nr:hypothetical protein ROHU_009437 [Labeo rohita]